MDQVFPIMPIQRLDEEPTIETTIQDVTCDSDGKIDMFVRGGEVARTIPLHPIKKDEPYFIAVYLVGAYQEILGDLHNLFEFSVTSTTSLAIQTLCTLSATTTAATTSTR